MRVIGIVTEFNPFHNGHGELIKRAREEVKDPMAVVMSVMSGPFVQRGLPSVLPKHVRAESALKCGADVVLEIPFTFACAPSERFAHGAVELLYRTGVVTDIAFGVDCKDPDILFELAEKEPDENILKECLASGMSFPAARSEALTATFKDITEEKKELIKDTLRQPNSILALDYIKEIRSQKAGFKIHMIKRTLDSSATAIREDIYSLENKDSVSEVADKLMGKIPDKALATYLSSLGGYCRMADTESYMGSVCREVERTPDMSGFAYMGDGLEGHIRNSLDSAKSSGFSSVSEKLATKHFTMPRIYRAMTSLLMGQSKDYVEEEKHLQYIRILGSTREGRYCLKIMGKCARLPLIHNCSDALELYSSNERLKKQFTMDLRANNIQAALLGLKRDYEWEIPPVISK
ncbi:MAG: nucleotidyltransferase family protein [Clostridiales bacterium]|nr:nucleotidyltransferase family protein [Clostridiales bacterium]